jgi:hypothetical protein
MFVNCFTITIPTNILEIAIKELSKKFGDNIPKSLSFDGGMLYYITHLFCVDENVDINVDIKEICNKYNCEIGQPYKIEIEDCMYNNNYTICISYKKEGPRFYLQLE